MNCVHCVRVKTIKPGEIIFPLDFLKVLICFHLALQSMDYLEMFQPRAVFARCCHARQPGPKVFYISREFSTENCFEIEHPGTFIRCSDSSGAGKPRLS